MSKRMNPARWLREVVRRWRLEGVVDRENFAEADITWVSERLAGVVFSECVFADTVFLDAHFERTIFRDCDFAGAYFSRVYFTGAELIDCNVFKIPKERAKEMTIIVTPTELGTAEETKFSPQDPQTAEALAPTDAATSSGTMQMSLAQLLQRQAEWGRRESRRRSARRMFIAAPTQLFKVAINAFLLGALASMMLSLLGVPFVLGTGPVVVGLGLGAVILGFAGPALVRDSRRRAKIWQAGI